MRILENHIKIYKGTVNDTIFIIQVIKKFKHISCS